MGGFTIIFISLLSISFCLRPQGFPFTYAKDSQIPKDENVQYQTLYFDQKVSHFNYKYSQTTFKQKYLMDVTTWDKGKGPILFYCGN